MGGESPFGPVSPFSPGSPCSPFIPGKPLSPFGSRMYEKDYYLVSDTGSSEETNASSPNGSQTYDKSRCSTANLLETNGS